MENFLHLFGTMIAFTYHCFDRVVIRGYLSMLSRPEHIVYFFRNVLGIPCITMRKNTERPITVSVGSNELAGTDPNKIISLAKKALAGKWKKSAVPPLWDGKAAERIVKILINAV